MSAPEISVILPVYNAERYIAKAVESILAQTFGDFEFLIVDDGSTDGSLSILQSIADRDSRIVLRSRENKGYVVTLNEMLAEARGDFIARMDADDIALPERFEKQMRFLARHDDILAVGTAQLWIDPQDRPLRRFTPPLKHEDIDAAHLQKGEGMICHPSVLMRREAIEAVGEYDENLYGAEDLDLWLRLAEVGRLANMDEVLIQYRFHSQKVGWLQKDRQVRSAITAMQSAAQRRGEQTPNCEKFSNANLPTVASQHLAWTWWALGDGNISTARRYAMLSILQRPFDLTAWRAFCCALRGR
ncbi:Putative glycosyltransferase EpsE [Symmachiella dynata]|uniref:Glycosyltransferase EpsE n=1 Tax=Symmachiella dynata TaxID=2527995 RepID=A0A517ZK52_9PLAN|nr:glycosyltransferase [Symmachiella dynata]QDU42783.1 Putative glycosyltransferase EpsE [Symmachiella dynata]